MKSNLLLVTAACALVAATTQAGTVNFNFLENGPGNLGNTSTFTDSGVSLTASGFLVLSTSVAPLRTDLWAKSTLGDPSESGLGTRIDSDHEINPLDFVQLALPTTPPTTFNMLLAASVQSGETAKIYFSTTPGQIIGATLIGTLTGNGTFTIPSGDQNGYIDITAGHGNVLLESASFTTPTVPDGGTTVALLGGSFALLGLVRRKLVG